MKAVATRDSARPTARSRGADKPEPVALHLVELPVRPPHPDTIQRHLASDSEAGAGADAYAEEEETREGESTDVQRAKAAGAVTPPPDDAITRAQQDQSPGEPLDAETRHVMERDFGYDFSAVRIHRDGHAATLAADIHAEAFTRGEHIYFSEGAYEPGSAAGRALLSHELTHVVQQAHGVTLPGGIDSPGDPYEAAAIAAETGTSGATEVRPLPVPADGVVQRREEGGPPAGVRGTPAAGTVNTGAGGAGTAPTGTASGAGGGTGNPSGAAPTTTADPQQSGGTGNSASNTPGGGGGQHPTGGPGADAPGASATTEMPAAEVAMPEGPTDLSPQAQAGLDLALDAAEQSADATSDVPSAERNVDDAQASVQHPEEQCQGEGAGQTAEELDTRPPPSPEIEAFCERVLRVIREQRPVDEEALARTDVDAAADAARREMQSSVEGEVSSVEGEYDQLQEEPTPSEPNETVPLPETPVSVETPPIAAEEGAPTPVPEENLSLEQDLANADEDIENAGMMTEPAQLVQSGPIAEVRDARGELGEASQADIAATRTREQQAIAGARADMAALQTRATEALAASRQQNVEQASLQQAIMSGDETAMRRAAGLEAERIFSEAQTRVRDLLQPLAANATTRWEEEMVPVKRVYRQKLDSVQAWIDERHEGFGGGVVAFLDNTFGYPGWITEAYNEAEASFAEETCALIRDISRDVNQVIQTAEEIIAQANRDIERVFGGLPEDVMGWGAEQQAIFSERLTALHQEVQQTRTNINTGLTDRAGAAIDEVRREIADLRLKAGGLLGRIESGIEAFFEDPARFLIDGLLELVGISPPAFWALVDRIGSVIESIADDPMNFANNLAGALKQGFEQFFDNFPAHMLQGFFDWLFSGLGAVGVEIPADFSLKSLITFFLQLMGITWARIRALLAKHIGEENVALIERAWEIISTLIEQGPQGIFEMIKEQLNPANLLQMVIDAAIDFIVETLITQVTATVVKMLNPAGIIVQAIEIIYKILKWVFDNAARIFTLVETVVNGAARLIAGDLGGMANAVESALARIIPPVIDFLASLIGLGDLPEKVADIVRDLQEWVEGILDRVIGALADQGRRLLAALGLGGEDDADEGLSEAEQAHQQMARSAAQTLREEAPAEEDESYADLRARKEQQAAQIASGYTAELEDGIAMSITFTANEAQDIEDEDMDFEVRVSPNDAVEESSISLVGVAGEVIVGRYREVRIAQGPGQQAHHVPPKGVMGWVGEQARAAARDLEHSSIDPSEWRWLEQLGISAHDVYKPGDPLAAIAVHEETHIRKSGTESDAWRIHWGRNTAEAVGRDMQQRAEDQGDVVPVRRTRNLHSLTISELKAALNDARRESGLPALSDSALESIATSGGGRPRTAPLVAEIRALTRGDEGEMSTQFYRSELNDTRLRVEVPAEVDAYEAFVATVGTVVRSAAVQSHQAVVHALSNSDKDGDWAETNSGRVNTLQSVSKQSWEEVAGISKLNAF